VAVMVWCSEMAGDILIFLLLMADASRY
jgi:hypothetical protein